MIHLTKNYSLCIYEYCKQYLNLRHSILKIDYLRSLLSLEKKYLDFNDFKSRVLNPALEEINKFSNIKISFLENHDSKNVNSIEFFIFRKEGIPLQKARTLTENLVHTDNQNKLQSLGFSFEEMDLMRQKNTEIKISAVLEFYEKHIDEVEFPKLWIKNALKKDYLDNTAYQIQLKKREESIELIRKKDTEIVNKKKEIRDIQEEIATIKKDIKFYQENGKLKPVDVMRFPAQFSVEQAINDLNTRIKTGELAIKNLKKEMKILYSETNDLK